MLDWRLFMRAVIPDQCARPGPPTTVEDMEALRSQVQPNKTKYVREELAAGEWHSRVTRRRNQVSTGNLHPTVSMLRSANRWSEMAVS
eukprot:7920360-Pyramimonas_sp.AAC.1